MERQRIKNKKGNSHYNVLAAQDQSHDFNININTYYRILSVIRKPSSSSFLANISSPSWYLPCEIPSLASWDKGSFCKSIVMNRRRISGARMCMYLLRVTSGYCPRIWWIFRSVVGFWRSLGWQRWSRFVPAVVLFNIGPFRTGWSIKIFLAVRRVRCFSLRGDDFGRRRLPSTLTGLSLLAALLRSSNRSLFLRGILLNGSCVEACGMGTVNG